MTEIPPERGGGPTVRRMLVGAQLRRLRTDKGISREQAGEAIRASEWKIHRLENGQVGFKDRDIVDLLALYGVDDPVEVVEFVILAREANTPGWWHQYGLGRQTLLERKDAPRLWAVVDEAALRRPVGGPKVMRAQLERLIEASELPNVTLQVLPFAAGAHPAMVGAFSILRFTDQELPDVVYVEHLNNATYLDKRDEVERYLDVMESLCLGSEPPAKTAEFLDRILDKL